MQTPEEKTMMSRIDMQASFEKSAKIQLDRNSHISLQNTNVAKKAKKYLNSNKKEAEKLLSDRNKKPIINYKGMWMPQPKPLRKMSRKEMIKHLRHFRNVWERETTRNQDLSDERLDEESDKDLRGLLKFYFSNEAKQIAGDWLR